MHDVGGYRVLREIARGGMGVVYQAQDASGALFALKVLLDHDPASAERFQREAQLAQELKHPNVVRVHGHGVTNGRPYLVMDYVDGEDLMARLKRDGPLPETEARRLFLLLGEALSAAHALGIVHRDLKPQNVLLRGAEVYLTDFGLARRGPSTLTATGELLGTPAYMAPEQAIGERDSTGPACDVYGLGATLYTALCGEPPHRAASLYATLDLVLNAEPPPLRPRCAQGLSSGLEELVFACLRKEANERPPLEAVLQGLSSPSGLTRGQERIGLLALVGVVALGGLGLAWSLASAPGLSVSPSASPISPISPVSARSTSPAESLASPALTPSTPSNADRAEAGRLAGVAFRFLEEHSYDRARESSERALEYDAGCGAAWVAKARWAFSTNRFVLAIKSARQVGPYASREVRASAHYVRGRALLRGLQDLPPGGNDKAYVARCSEAFEASLQARPSARAWAWLGRAQFMAGDLRGARGSLAKGLKLSRVTADLAVLSHDLQPERKTLHEFIEEGKRHHASARLSFEFVVLLLAYSVSGGDDLEVRGSNHGLLAQARRMRPREGSAIGMALADAYLHRTSRRGVDVVPLLEKAKEHVQAGLKGVPQGSRRQNVLLGTLGRVHFSLGEYEAALAPLEAALAIQSSPKHQRELVLALHRVSSPARRNWDTAAAQGLLARARKACSPTLERNIRVRQGRVEGWLQTMQSDFAAAERSFAAALVLGKGQAETTEKERARVRELALVYIARGRSRLLSRALGRASGEAVDDFRQAARVDPSYVMAKAWLAQGLALEGREEEALAQARATRKALPQGHPARIVADLVLASPAGGWAALVAFLKVEPGNPRILGIAQAQDPVRAQALVEAPGPHAAEHPLVILAGARAGRLAGKASPEWFRRAEARLTRELEAHSDFEWLRVERGLIRIEVGDLKGGLADLERAQRTLAEPSVQAVLDSLKGER